MHGLKYRALTSIYHALYYSYYNCNRFCGSVLSNLDFGEYSIQLPSCRLYLHRGLHFFIEEWKEQRSKPKLIVEPVNLRPEEQPLAIRVVFDSKTWKEREARFFFVSVRNIGRKTAENTEPVIHLPKVRTGLIGQFVLIGPSGAPFIPVEWGDPVEDFETNSNRYARALIVPKSERITSVSLNPQGMAKAFMLFFTVKESNVLYFPVRAPITLPIPARFYLVLLFQAKDMPLQAGKTYEVDVATWDHFQVKEVPVKIKFPEPLQAS